MTRENSGGGREVLTGMLTGLVIGSGATYLASHAIAEAYNAAQIRPLSECISYQQENPEMTGVVVSADSVPKHVLASCGLIEYVLSPNEQSSTSAPGQEVRDRGAKVIYGDVQVQLPGLTQLSEARASYTDGSVRTAISVAGSLVGLLVGGIAGGLLGLVRVARK